MTRKERFYATIERRKVDHPASWLGLPVPEACEGLFNYFGVDSMVELKRILGDDVFPVDVPYHHPPVNHIACAFDFAQQDNSDYEHRTLTSTGIFADCSDLGAVADFAWPDPAENMDIGECAQAVQSVPEDYAVLAMMWSAHFQDACAAFGMEAAMMKMLTEPEMFRAVIDRITEFYLKANRIFYETAAGHLDAVLIGNDLGSQTALMLSPELIREFVFPGTKRLVDQAKSYGLKVIHHSCGAVADIISDLIAIGVDAIHPIQVLANGMAPELLQERFGGNISFCGGVDVQEMLVHESPREVKRQVGKLKELFPTGLIISPSHEAVLPDVKPENLKAMFETVNSD